MKVAFIANTSWNIYNFRKGLVQTFIQEGHDVIFLAPKDEYSEKVESWGARFCETPIDGTGSNPLKDFYYFLLLFSLFKKEKPDVCLSYTIKSNIYTCLASAVFKTKSICNVSGLGTVFLVKGLTGKIAMALYRISFRFADFIFFQNEDDKGLFLENVPLAIDKTGLLPGSGIDLEEFKQQRVKVGSPLKILMIARVIEEKGVREFAEAASNFNSNEVEFRLVGKHDEGHSRSVPKSELDHWVKKGWIKYLSHSNNIKELITESEVVMLPSYREGTPRTLLEAGALGRTLMASNVPGCKEVIKSDFNGYLFDVKSSNAIVASINNYMNLPNDSKYEMAMNSHEYISRKFDQKIVIDRYKSVIDQISA